MGNKRLELERKIIDATEGLLSDEQISLLKDELSRYPDLQADFFAMMNQTLSPDLYGETGESKRYQSQIANILGEISELDKTRDDFAEVTIHWFRRYAIAASVAVLVLSSIFNLSVGSDTYYNEEFIISDLLYPDQPGDADDYLIYLDEISNQ